MSQIVYKNIASLNLALRSILWANKYGNLVETLRIAAFQKENKPKYLIHMFSMLGCIGKMFQSLAC